MPVVESSGAPVASAVFLTGLGAFCAGAEVGDEGLRGGLVSLAA